MTLEQFVLVLVILLIIVVLLFYRNNSQDKLVKKLIEDQKSIIELQMKNTQLSEELRSSRETLTQHLFEFQNQITSSMKGDFNLLNESTLNRLMNIEKQVNQSLMQGFDSTNQSFLKVTEQMIRVDEAQKKIQDLSQEIKGLQGILKDKKTRGTFGEVQLYSLLENVYGINDSRYLRQYKLSNGMIADCVLFAPKPLGNIVIDSKFPLENYNRMVDTELGTLEVLKAKNEFRKDVAKHIKDISSKYLIENETAEFAYMFIPAESIFSEIVGNFDDLVELSYSSHVYLVSPTTLMAYITAIQAIYLSFERNEKVAEIQEEYQKLAIEFKRFKERWQFVEKDFEKTWRDIQNLSTTTVKLMSRFQAIEEVKFDKENGN